MEGTTLLLLPFSHLVDRVNVIDEGQRDTECPDPSPAPTETVNTPSTPTETPDWLILSEVVSYHSSSSPGLEIAPNQSVASELLWQTLKILM